MKKYILLLISLFLFSNCSIDDTPPMDSVIKGQWKLVSARVIDFVTNPTIDYSDRNIIYDFQADGTLIVTGGNNVGYTDGTYSYVFGLDYLSNAPIPNQNMMPLIQVNNLQKWVYQMVDGQMILRTSYIDGPDLTFERIWSDL